MRKVCVYTSTRADYGLLRKLIFKINTNGALKLQMLVSGTHLVAAQGMTIREIQADNLKIDDRVDIDLSDDSPQGICNSMGMAITRYSESLIRLSPDILVILGDRFESFCCAAAATINRIPVAHIHGGESTEGLIDEAFRHSITKMSFLHFPSCECYRKRIIQMGESPDRVYNVGALAVENIKSLKLMEKKELEADLEFELDKPYFIVTFHPVTLEKDTADKQFANLLNALKAIPNKKLIFTYANADTEGRNINYMIDEHVRLNPKRCLATPSLGYLRYLSAVKYCSAVIGNSSSGILEAPSLMVPTVNIGDRQKGRIRAESVIDCGTDQESIKEAIFKALTIKFKESIKDMKNPFDMEDTSDRVLKMILVADLTACLKKSFYDLYFDTSGM